MRNIYEMRNEFTLREYNTAITRADFEANFIKTKERIALPSTAGMEKATMEKAAAPAFTAPASKDMKKHGLSRLERACIILTKTEASWRKPPVNTTRKQAGW